MYLLSVRDFFDNIRNYYLNLPEISKLIIYIILILTFISIILSIILLEQKRSNRQKLIIRKEQELDDIYSNLEIDEDNEKTRNLKEITDKIQQQLDNKAIDLTKYEEDQEETSVISYNELIQKIGKPATEPKEEFNLDNLVHKIEEDEKIEQAEPYVINPEQEKTGFKNSIFISPIYGSQENIQKETIVNHEPPKVEKIQEQPQIIKPQTPEMLEEEKFLNNLKKFRNNLE